MLQFPDNFDGRFYFTNWTDEDFEAKWAGISYTFPAMKTSPILIPSESFENIQSIRKVFAKKLAEREFYKSAKLRDMEGQTPRGTGESLQTALTYTESELAPYIQKCLEELPIAKAEMKVNPVKEIPLKTDGKGRPISKVIQEGDSLVGEGTVVA